MQVQVQLLGTKCIVQVQVQMQAPSASSAFFVAHPSYAQLDHNLMGSRKKVLNGGWSNLGLAQYKRSVSFH